MQWFKFNGIDSKDKGIHIKKMPPLVSPKRDIESIKVDGRNGNFYIDNETYESYNITIDCAVIDLTKIDEIKAYLTGVGTLELSTKEGVEYDCFISNQIPIGTYLTHLRDFPLQLEVNPIGRSKTLTTETKTTSPATFTVDGTIGVPPTLEIKGTGEATITLNGKSFTIDDLSATETIVDCELMNVTKNGLQANDKFVGTFPSLVIGTNNLSWTGTITEVKIKFKKGWL